MQVTKKWLAAAWCSVALGACGKESAPEPRLAPASATVPASERGVEELASLRCDHEQLCNNIGPNATYPDRDNCLSVARMDARGELATCLTGVDQDALPTCFEKIAEQDCNNLVDSLARISECRARTLCSG